MQGYCDFNKVTLWRKLWPGVNGSHLTLFKREMCMLSFSTVNYHKFSHGATSYMYMPAGKHINVMLELDLFEMV